LVEFLRSHRGKLQRGHLGLQFVDASVQRGKVILSNFPWRGFVVVGAHAGIVRYFVVTAGRRPSQIYLYLFVLPICSHNKVSYNTLVLQNTTTSGPILLALPTKPYDRSAFLYSALDSGWIRVAYRKADGTCTIRLGTRNPTLVAKYGNNYSARQIKDSEFTQNAYETIVYFDHSAGALRAFRVDRVDAAGIDAVSIENNH